MHWRVTAVIVLECIHGVLRVSVNHLDLAVVPTAAYRGSTVPHRHRG